MYFYFFNAFMEIIEMKGNSHQWGNITGYPKLNKATQVGPKLDLFIVCIYSLLDIIK